MCDGVTQGQPGMDLSLFSRDVIAMATAISLSHNMFDAAVYLGICDKIVPGLMIGALTFGHIPAVFVPAGPMPAGLPNDEKSRVRQLFMEGKVGRAELLEAESRSYHSPGTCTFYGTANSNQMLMEIMGLHLPGSSFVNPDTPLREALTREAARRALSLSAGGENFTPIADVVDEKALVNGLVGLLATGGSTNHTLHIIAIAAAAGIKLTWQDMSDLSDAVPLLARVYPNGLADVNAFHAAGGMGYLIGQLLEGGFVHEDVKTVWGTGLGGYTVEAKLIDGQLAFEPAPAESAAPKVLASVTAPFSPTGGLKVLKGNLDHSVIKISAVKPEHRLVEAPARVFHSQAGLQAAFKAGELDGDVVAVVRFSGPRAIGMPELHKLTPVLGVLQDSWAQGGSGHRRTDVRRFGQGAGRHPCHARSGRWRSDRQDPRRRPAAARRRGRNAGLSRRRRRVPVAHPGPRGPAAGASGHGPRTLRRLPPARRFGRSGCQRFRIGLVSRAAVRRREMLRSAGSAFQRSARCARRRPKAVRREARRCRSPA